MRVPMSPMYAVPSALTIMSLSEPRAADDRSACTAISPSGSTRRRRWVSIATTRRRPSGNQPRPDGSSSSMRTIVVASPSRVVATTRWSCMSLNQSRPSCHRGPSPKTRSSRMVRTSAGSAIRARYRRLCNVGQMNQPVSAARVAELLGDSLPDPAQIPAEAFDLVAATRELVEAVVMTDVDAGTRADAAAELRRLAETLGAARRAPTSCSWPATPMVGWRASPRPGPVGSTRRRRPSSGSTDRRNRHPVRRPRRSRFAPGAPSAPSTRVRPGACMAVCSRACSTRCSASPSSCRARPG